MPNDRKFPAIRPRASASKLLFSGGFGCNPIFSETFGNGPSLAEGKATFGEAKPAPPPDSHYHPTPCFAKHLKTLSDEEQLQFKQGTHPSQSHRFDDRAQPFVALLQEHLANLGFPAKVCLGMYHMDRIVLSADLEADPGERRSELPWVFRGFEIKYSWPQDH